MKPQFEHASHDDRSASAPSASALRATVLSSLTNGLFRLQLADGRELTAHIALDLRKTFTRLLPKDAVVVEVSPFDPNKGRICRLLNSLHPSAQATASPESSVPSAPNSENCREGQSQR